MVNLLENSSSQSVLLRQFEKENQSEHCIWLLLPDYIYSSTETKGIDFTFSVSHSVETRKDKKAINLSRLDSYKDLDKGWNGYNGRKFSAIVIKRAKKIISNLTKQPHVFPTGRNSIQIEYRKPNKDYLEFEIYSNKIEFYMRIEGNEEENIIKSSQIEEIVTSFYAQFDNN